MVATKALSEHLATLALSPARPSPSTSKPSTSGPSSSTSSTAAAASTTDLGVNAAVTALVHHLTLPLAPCYSHATISSLRSALHTRLSAHCTPTWRPEEPISGSGARSMICLRRSGLPSPLKAVAKEQGISEIKWIKVLAKPSTSRVRDKDAGQEDEVKVKLDEWEVWCDPGMVAMRHGPWEWYDAEFDPVRSYREPIVTLWHAIPATSPSLSNAEPNALSVTPARPNAAIPIRAPAPALFAIPPTPSHSRTYTPREDSTVPSPRQPLMPAAHIGTGGFGIGHSRSSSATFSSRTPSPTEDEMPLHRAQHVRATTFPARSSGANGGGHRTGGSGSTSSTSSSISDSNTAITQLLTPASRAGSADPFTLAAREAEDSDGNKSDPEVEVEADAYVYLRGKETPSDVTATPTPARGRDPSPTTISTGANTLLRAGNTAQDGYFASKAVAPTPTSGSSPNTTAGAGGAPTPSPGPAPTVTPYDGGNVTVLGGGVKLGGASASRTGSIVSQHRIPLDRARSPSISLASRALNTALSPHEGGNGNAGTGGGRKPRTRRRIMPTYLGYVGQPGVGGPVPHAFQPSLGKIPQGQPGGQMPGQGQWMTPGMGMGMGVNMGMGMGMGMGPMGMQGVRQPLQRLA